MRKLTYFAAVLCIILTAFEATSQEESKEGDVREVLYLKDGSKLMGNTVEVKEDGTIVFELYSGIRLDVAKQRIDRLVHRGDRDKAEDVPFEPGFFGGAHVNFIAADLQRNHGDAGVSASLQFGYSFHGWLEAGVGLGAENYAWNSRELVYPVYALLRGSINTYGVKPLYQVKAGYGMAFVDQDAGVTRANGGIYLQTSVGLKFGRQKQHFEILVGVNIQKARYRLEFGSPGEYTDLDLTYKRLVFGIGLTFR
jgi:hypothetical protein